MGKLDKALMLSLKGQSQILQGKPEEALLTYSESYALRLNELGDAHLDVASALQNMAMCTYKMGDYQNAEALFYRSLSIQEEQRNYPFALSAKTHNNLANLYLDNLEHIKARRHFLKAIEFQAQAAGQIADLVPKYVGLGNVWMETNRPDSAVWILQQALGLANSNEITKFGLELRTNLGNAHFQSGNYRKALEILEETQKEFYSLHKTHPVPYGNCLYNLANCYFALGDFRNAGILYRSARFYLSEDPVAEADILQASGRLERYLGNQEEAINLLSDAVSQYLVLTESPSIRYRTGRVFFDLGNLYLDMAAPQAAEYYFNQALRYTENLKFQEREKKRITLKLAACQLGMGQAQTAQSLIKEVLAYCDQYPDIPLNYAAWSQKAQIHISNRKWTTALNCYRQARMALDFSGAAADQFPFEYVQVLKSIAQVQLYIARQNDSPSQWSSCLTTAREGVAALRPYIQKSVKEASPAAIDQLFSELYDIAIESAIQLDSIALAFNLTEDAKKKLQLRLIWKDHWKTGFGVPDSVLISLQEKKENLQQLKKERYTRTDPADLKRIAELDQQIARKSDDITQTIASFEAQYPNYYELLYNQSSHSLGDYQEQLKADECILSYHVSSQYIYAFIINNEDITHINIPNIPELRDAVLDFASLCKNNPDFYNPEEKVQRDQQLIDLGISLYQDLVQPIESLLEDRIILIPHDWLCLLPFAALLTSNTNEQPFEYRHHPWMIHDHQLIFSYSAGLWLYLQQETTKAHKNPILVLAPSFHNDSRRLKALPYAQEEAHLVSKKWKNQAALYIGKSATEEQFREIVGQYAIVHLSSHAQMIANDPAFSYVAFTELDDGVENEYLYVAEIYDTPIDAGLVVLSACETAGGQVSRGEGLISITRAFHYAGTRNIISSLWQVDDRQATVLMDALYDELIGTQIAPLCLQNAQKKYMERSSYSKAHPYFWAGYTAFGAGDAIVLPSAATFNWWILLLIPLGILLFFLFKK